ncbi:hypothetical protein VPNG_02444 [Cytospora leucostoma]|uniref:Uncharacterized protein n=1 Tax=Cytospora leucostoma TaxID=1230097 RepID=A0A423XII7_9PEZI|nr:hypothetical protein VPNG_02444 [Cytospora leucostoma]
MVSFSDEFTAYAKEEDAINNQHSSNWILCYVIITIIPFAFVASAWWSTRQHKKAKAAARAESDGIEMRDLEAAAAAGKTTMAAATTRTPAPRVPGAARVASDTRATY